MIPLFAEPSGQRLNGRRACSSKEIRIVVVERNMRLYGEALISGRSLIVASCPRARVDVGRRKADSLVVFTRRHPPARQADKIKLWRGGMSCLLVRPQRLSNNSKPTASKHRIHQPRRHALRFLSNDAEQRREGPVGPMGEAQARGAGSPREHGPALQGRQPVSGCVRPMERARVFC